jgi:hypothetical protein
MAQVSVDIAGPDDAVGRVASRFRLSPAILRLLLIAAATASSALAWLVTRNDLGMDPDVELMRVLQFMTAAKALIGAGALWMVSIRFRYPIALGRAFGYIAGAAIMASGPGAMWSTAHIILGSLLFYGGLSVLAAIGWIDGRRGWRLGSRAPDGTRDPDQNAHRSMKRSGVR